MFLLIYIFHCNFFQTCQIFSPVSPIHLMITTGLPSLLALSFIHFLPPYSCSMANQWPNTTLNLITILIVQVIFLSLELGLWNINGASCVPLRLLMKPTCVTFQKSLLKIMQRFPLAHLRSQLVSLTCHHPPLILFFSTIFSPAFIRFSPNLHLLASSGSPFSSSIPLSVKQSCFSSFYRLMPPASFLTENKILLLLNGDMSFHFLHPKIRYCIVW